MANKLSLFDAKMGHTCPFATAKIRIVYRLTILKHTFYIVKSNNSNNLVIIGLGMNDKKEIRREVRRRIGALSTEEKSRAAEQIFSDIESMESFRSTHNIALFAAMNDEVPTAIALERWPKMGKHVVVPRVEGDIMRFYDYSPERMQTGAFGIEEPMGDEEFAAGDIDLIIVPARAFTLRGERLGRGGGFYDKYMSLPTFRATKIGIAFSCQIFDYLPCDKHDILVDSVVYR